MITAQIPRSFVNMCLLILCLLALTGCSPDYKAWRQASRQDTVDAYKQYLKEFPESSHSQEARKRIDALLTVTVEGKLTIGMVYGGIGADGVNLTPSISLEAEDGKYEILTSDDTVFVNLEKQGNLVSYSLGDTARYRISGKPPEKADNSTQNISRTLVATRVELLKK